MEFTRGVVNCAVETLRGVVLRSVARHGLVVKAAAWRSVAQRGVMRRDVA